MRDEKTDIKRLYSFSVKAVACIGSCFFTGGIYWFIYSFNKYLLNVCSLLGMVLGTGSTVNKTDKNPCPRGGHSMVGGD